MKRVLVTVAVVVIGFLVWWAWRDAEHNVQKIERAGQPIVAQASADQKTATANTVPDTRSTLADSLNSSTTNIRADLALVASIVDTFRTNFPQSGNPVGDNAEITATLTGRNPLRLSLIPRDHPAINARGELCDRWGTPFFFHAESRERMEIRSAGPNGKMWTDDDVTFDR